MILESRRLLCAPLLKPLMTPCGSIIQVTRCPPRAADLVGVFCVTAVLVTNSICWARFERQPRHLFAGSLVLDVSTQQDTLGSILVASVRVILRHHGSTSGNLVIDDTDNPRSKSAKALAYLYKLRDKESGGLWGQSPSFSSW